MGIDVIVLSGGLGNQMSQFAFFLAKKHTKAYLNSYFLKKNAEHNGYELKRVFGIRLQENKLINLIVKFMRKLLVFSRFKAVRVAIVFLDLIGIHIIKEPENYAFRKDYLRKKRGLNIYLGGWHSEKYFIDLNEEIENIFNFDKSRLNKQTQSMLDIIEKENSVSIHIRRGDHMNDDNYKVYGGLCSVEYYKKAIEVIADRTKHPVFIVFSEDTEWVKRNMSFISPTYYVTWNNGLDSWQDMFLMSHCKHNITANSTFSWWGAWLNANKNKIVIHPVSIRKDIDTPDIFPETWMTIK